MAPIEENPVEKRQEKTIDFLMKIIIILAGVVSTISMFVAGHTLQQLISANREIKIIQQQIVEIKANRFTVYDGIKLEERIKEYIPPKWVAMELRSLREDVSELQNRRKK